LLILPEIFTGYADSAMENKEHYCNIFMQINKYKKDILHNSY